VKDYRQVEMAGAWIALARHSHRVDMKRVALGVGSAASMATASARDLVGLGLSPRLAGEVSSESPQVMGSDWLTVCCPDYPNGLMALPHPPAVLWLRGDVSLLDKVAVAVVGSRNCTPYGRSVARSVAGTIVASGGIVVSGGARGIDRVAHEEALSKTIIVLGCGLLHPSADKWVRWVEENGGLLVSEFHPIQSPTRWSFPQRNRIIAALSVGTVVVEAGPRSGATITARKASELNRDVFAVPGRIDAPASQGTNRLIAAGANCLVSTGEIVELLASRVDDSRRIVSALCSPSTIGEVASRLALPIAETCQWLSLLETSGAVVRVAGGRYGLSTHR
jgi:DNA protecting protein DprA